MIRKEQQRFSLRKYKVGVASVFLGTTLSFMLANGGAVKASELPTQPSSEEKTELVKKDSGSEDSSKKEVNVVENVATTELAETKKVEEAKPSTDEVAKPDAIKEEAKPASEIKTEDPKSVPVSSEKAEEAEPATAEGGVTAEETAKPAEKAEEAKPATEAKPAIDESNKPRVRSRRAVTNEAVTGDHNTKPVSVSTYLKDGETVDPSITNPNGATVKSQDVPAGYSRKEGDWYTYSIVELTEFNKRYNTNYYSRSYKKFNDSTDTIVELIDKNTGAVVETKTISATSGVQKFATTATASNGELTYQVDYDKGTPTSKAETAQPFLQYGFEVGAAIQALVAPGHQLTTEEQKLYDAVYATRTSTDIINVVEPVYNGRRITDTNSKIPSFVEKTTYYKVVDKNNPSFNAAKTDKTVQDYVENGNEVDLAKYTTKAMEGQNFTASGERQFDGYKLYQTADPED